MSSKPTGRIILAAAVGALIAGGGAVWFAGIDRDGFAAAARYTARWSLLWFVAAWSASALARLWPGGWRGALLYNRRGIGLGFATAHLIHAGFFSVAIWGFGAPSNIVTILGGGLGYVFVLLMAITSNEYWVRALTPRGWKLLHTIGAGYVAFVFVFTYYGRLATDPALGIAGLTLIGAAILLRLSAWLARRARAAT